MFSGNFPKRLLLVFAFCSGETWSRTRRTGSSLWTAVWRPLGGAVSAWINSSSNGACDGEGVIMLEQYKDGGRTDNNRLLFAIIIYLTRYTDIIISSIQQSHVPNPHLLGNFWETRTTSSRCTRITLSRTKKRESTVRESVHAVNIVQTSRTHNETSLCILRYVFELYWQFRLYVKFQCVNHRAKSHK